ncbi:restriction endonuclease subunit S [Bacteroides caecimuris]
MRKNKNNLSKLPLTISAQYGLVDQITFFNKVVASTDMSNYYLLKKGEFAYNKSYSSDYPWGAIKRLDNYEQGALSSLYICFAPKDNVETDFILQYFESPKWHKGVSEIAVEGARNHGLLNISVQDFFHTHHYMPKDKKEQAKIAKLLMFLDERIATQNKIIEDLKKLKSAIIEKLYSDIKGREYSYRQIFEIVNERNKQLEYLNILSASQEKGMVNREDLNLDIQFERSNINTYKIVKEGDYVIHLRSFQGGFAFSDKHGVCSPAYTILRPNDLLEFRYLSYYFTSQRFIKSLIVVTYGIRDGRSINVEEWLDMKTIIPSKERQHHIVETIRNIENKIENEEKYASCLSNQKQYLLHHLFI